MGKFANDIIERQEITRRLDVLSADMEQVFNPTSQTAGVAIEDRVLLLKPIENNIIAKYLEESRDATPKEGPYSLTACSDHMWEHYNGKKGFDCQQNEHDFCNQFNASFCPIGLLGTIVSTTVGVIWFIANSTEFSNQQDWFAPYLSILGGVLFWLIYIGQAYRLHKLRKLSATKQREDNDRNLMEKINRLRTEPTVLIDEVQRYLNGIVKDYRERILELKKQFEGTTIEVRENAKQAIVELTEQIQGLERKPENVSRNQLLVTMEDLVKQYKLDADREPAPDEREIIDIFNRTAGILGNFQDQINGLSQLRTEYQEIEQVVDLIEKHLVEREQAQALHASIKVDVKTSLLNMQNQLNEATTEVRLLKQRLPLYLENRNPQLALNP